MRRQAVAAVVLALGLVVLTPAGALAHPLGNFTVNTSSALELTPKHVTVHYVLDMAEIPTVQAMPSIDTDGDGTADASEQLAWAETEATSIGNHLLLEVDGRPVPLAAGPATMELLPGQGGLHILRLETSFTGMVAAAGKLTYRDDNFADRTGWREVVIAGEGTALTDTSFPTTSPTDLLRSYPTDALSSPLRVTEAHLSYAPVPAAIATTAAGTETATLLPDESGVTRPGTDPSGFASLLTGSGFSVLALLLAVGFGAAHALAPGHGKTLVAAYLVGSGAKMRQAAVAGGAVALMHTASVLLLGTAVLSAQKLFAPEHVYPWLGLASGVLVLILGGRLLYQRTRGMRSDRHGAGDSPHDHSHHGHDSQSGQGHSHGHGVDSGHGHAHPTLPPDVPLLSRKGLAAIALSGGMLPSPTALVVLLGSVALHRVAFGLALIAAFSIGLAGALVFVGVVAVRARDAFTARFGTRLSEAIPVAGATVMLIAGAILAVRGASQL